MTSAADLLPTQPAARPDAAVRGRASEDKVSDSGFADLLDVETPEADLTDDTMSTEAVVVPAPAQPVTQQPIPTADSAIAILAGLTTEGGEKIDAAAGAETLPVLPEFAGDDGVALPQPAAPTATAETAPAPAARPEITIAPLTVPVSVEATTTNPAPAAVAAPAPVAAATAVAAKPVVEADEPGEETAEASADPAADADEAAAKPVVTAPETSPIIATAAAVRPAVAPAPAIVTPEAPTSAPGAERMAAEAPDASAPRQLNGATPAAAAQGEAGRAQGAPTRPTQANASAADAAANISADDALSTTPSVATEITAPRAQAGGEAARPTAAHPALQNAPTATIQVYQRMIERVDGRAQRFEVRLDPAELGRVDVRIEVGADKKVHAVLAAHDSAALNDLMRGQRALERALTDAGIDLADGGVRFELSSDTSRGSANNQGRGDGNAAPADVWRRFSTIDVATDQQTANAARSWRPSRLDLVA